ncbi:hypothetical protein DPX39_040075100 [Trypanosoma brucei equiperdum]|uniref:Uncharacterized protein n=1 Tax=Trypanosoma brucei equiperdum TaxID=630700 RepID=A0A3L6LF35_9TRYP|nr:hypothetical protein DPX39_040075100 [Trypanosoma brucei equiperdum]
MSTRCAQQRDGMSLRCRSGRRGFHILDGPDTCRRSGVGTRGSRTPDTKSSPISARRAFSCVGIRTRSPNSCMGTRRRLTRDVMPRSCRTPSPRARSQRQQACRGQNHWTPERNSTCGNVKDDNAGNNNSDNSIVSASTADIANDPKGEPGVPVKKREENLTLKDVEELRRRREQLRYGVDTSLSRITELQLLTQSFRSGQRNTTGEGSNSLSATAISAAAVGDGATGSVDNDEMTARPTFAEDYDTTSGKEEALLFLHAAEEEYIEFRLQLTLANAALSAVPQSLWADIRRFRQPPPAVAAVMDAMLILLGFPRIRRMRLSFGSGGWPSLPQQLIRCEPLTAYLNIAELTGRDSQINGCSPLEELEQFLRQWTHLRVSRVHPTLGPLHQWVKAMLDASRAAGRLKTLRDASRAADITPVTDRVALLRELEENEEYVQLAQEEIRAIDALVADVAAAGAKGHYRTSLNPGSLYSPRGSVAGGIRETGELAEKVGGAAAGRFGAARTSGKEVSRNRRLQNSCPTAPRFGAKAALAAGGLGSLKADPARPTLSFKACMSSFNQVEQGPRSLRERFERLKTSSLCHSPRVGPGSHLEGSTARDGLGCSTEVVNSIGGVSLLGTTRVFRDREKLLLRVHQLEEQLSDICSNQPGEVELVLMRDELAATQDEVNKLRKERDELQQRLKRYEAYDGPPSPRRSIARRLNHNIANTDEDASTAIASGEIMTIMALEQQLRAAHTRIQHLESVMMGATSDDGTRCTSASGSGNESPETPYDSTVRPCNLAASNLGHNASSLGEMVFLQRRLDDMQQSLEVQQCAVSEAEERLNNEMHAKNEAQQLVRQLQAELRSVWQKLEITEYQLKLALEGSHCHRSCMDGNNLGTEFIRDLQRQRQREAICEGEIERLRMQLREQKERSAEGRRRRLEIRRVRTALLLKLENALSEALRQHEG